MIMMIIMIMMTISKMKTMVFVRKLEVVHKQVFMIPGWFLWFYGSYTS